jgi:hypothetical protein
MNLGYHPGFAPMPHPLVQFTAARYVLGLTQLPELIQCADALLTERIYTYSLGELFTYRWESRANPEWLFENAASELGMVLPSREEAAFHIAQHHLTDIIEGRSSIRAGMTTLRVALNHELPWQGEEMTGPARCQELFDGLPYNYRFIGLVSSEELNELESVSKEVELELVWKVRTWIHHNCGTPFDAAWRTATVSQLATAISADVAFDNLPILADALEEAGCVNHHILDHCRFPSGHVRHCWVVDLILGRSE